MGRCPRIYEVLILLSRLWADSAYGRLHHSRGFDLSNCRFWHDLRGFDLAFSPRETWFTRFWSQERQYIYTIYIMYIRGFDLASDTQTGCYIRGFDLQHHKIRRLYARGFDLSAGRVQRSDSRGLYLSPTCGIPKTRSKPRNGGTLERPETDTKCDSLS